MAKVIIVTDSAADFAPGVLEDLDNVRMVPFTVRFGEEEYLDKVTLFQDEFFAKMKAKKEKKSEYPKTAQPSPEAFKNVFEENGKKSKEIICINISSKVSGAYDSALLAAKSLPNLDIRVVDTLSLLLCQGFLVEKAARMAKDGEGLEKIVKTIEDLKPKMKMFGVVGTLDYLSEGGRIGPAKHFIGSLLNVKPILKFDEGKIAVAAIARTEQKAMEKMIELFKKQGQMKRVGVVHADAKEKAQELAKMLEKYYKDIKIFITQTGTALGTHSGPGFFGPCGQLE